MNPHTNKEKIFEKYSEHRWKVDLVYLKRAVDNYNVFKGIKKQLGYPENTMEIFTGSSIIHSVVSRLTDKKSEYMEKIRVKAFGVMYSRKNL
jgi:hypothetical protein